MLNFKHIFKGENERMKKSYKTQCYYLDKDVLLYGYKDKYGFHPQKGLACGFSRQIIKKKDIGKTLFYDIADASKRLDSITLVGGTMMFMMDNGLAQTKIIYTLNRAEFFTHKTQTIVKDATYTDEINEIISECLNQINITKTVDTKIKVRLMCESGKVVTNSFFTNQTPKIAEECDTMLLDQGTATLDFIILKN